MWWAYTSTTKRAMRKKKHYPLVLDFRPLYTVLYLQNFSSLVTLNFSLICFCQQIKEDMEDGILSLPYETDLNC